MKNFFYLFVAGLLAVGSGKLEAQENNTHDPVYLEIISNGDKTMDFTLGLYPETYNYNYDKKYSSMKLKILCNSTTTLEWKDYKIYILLKDNTLFYNYKTNASSGAYCCHYSISHGEIKEQILCFARKFNIEDIDKVWLSLNDSQFFNLVLNERN
jgi:hypothetical protein